MRNGTRAFTLAIGALALGMLSLPGTSRAMPGPALDRLGSTQPQANIERAIGPGDRFASSSGQLTPEKITYRSRYYYRGNPFRRSYGYYSPRYRYSRSPRYSNYGKGRAYYYNSWRRKFYRPYYYR